MLYFCRPFFEDDNSNYQLSIVNFQFSIIKKGMYGFDSKMNCHVSMPSLAVTLVNLDCKRIIGENNYAFAA